MSEVCIVLNMKRMAANLEQKCTENVHRIRSHTLYYMYGIIFKFILA